MHLRETEQEPRLRLEPEGYQVPLAGCSVQGTVAEARSTVKRQFLPSLGKSEENTKEIY